MPIDSSSSGFPTKDMLTRFFRMDRDAMLDLAHAAALLGMSLQQLQGIAEREGGMLSWDEVAYHLFTLWPRAKLLAALGADDAHRIPKFFFPTPVAWMIPRYIQLAMERQARRASEDDERAQDGAFVRPSIERGISDYVADILHERIDVETADAMRRNRAFLDAFHFPHERGGRP